MRQTLCPRYRSAERTAARGAFETAVELIGHTRTAAGPRGQARLDKRRYKTGLTVTTADMKRLALHRHPFHGDWDFELRWRPP